MGEVAKAESVSEIAVSSVPVMATRLYPNSLVRLPSSTPVTRHTTMKELKMMATVVDEVCHSASCCENRMPKDGGSIGTTICSLRLVVRSSSA